MVSIIDILIYFGYDNPWQVYQSINQDILIDLRVSLYHYYQSKEFQLYIIDMIMM